MRTWLSFLIGLMVGACAQSATALPGRLSMESSEAVISKELERVEKTDRVALLGDIAVILCEVTKNHEERIAKLEEAQNAK